MEGVTIAEKETPPAALGRAERAAPKLAVSWRADSGWEGARASPGALSTPRGFAQNASCAPWHRQSQRNSRKPHGQRLSMEYPPRTHQTGSDTDASGRYANHGEPAVAFRNLQYRADKIPAHKKRVGRKKPYPHPHHPASPRARCL